MTFSLSNIVKYFTKPKPPYLKKMDRHCAQYRVTDKDGYLYHVGDITASYKEELESWIASLDMIIKDEYMLLFTTYTINGKHANILKLKTPVYDKKKKPI